MARLQAAIKNLVEVYVEYSDGDGKLSKEQLQKIMDKEIDCPEAKAKMASCSEKGQGEKCDGNCDFEDFLKLVCKMAKCGYKKQKGCEATCAK